MQIALMNMLITMLEHKRHIASALV